MNNNHLMLSGNVPALFAPSPDAGKRFIEFFPANIRNPNTRKAYAWVIGICNHMSWFPKFLHY